MSKQRYLLISVLLFLAATLPAQSSLSLETAFGMEFRNMEPGQAGENRFAWEQQLSPNWQIFLASTLHSTDLRSGANPQNLWHNGELGIHGKLNAWNLNAGYRNLLFGGSELLGLYPIWQPLVSQERFTQHQGTLSAGYAAPFVEAESHAQIKYLSYRPWELDLTTFELVPGPNEGISDLYYGFGLQTPRLLGVSARLAANRHDALYTGLYDLDQIRGGLDAGYELWGSASISGSFDWTYRAGDAIPGQKRHLLTSTLRYQQRLTPDLFGFVYYVNNSCLDDSLSGLYLMSNYLRAQVKYSLPGDPSAGSYLLAGGKFSPENSANAIFAETDLRVWDNLYAGGGVSYQPGRQLSISGKIGWFFTPHNELRLLVTHRANQILNYSRDFVGLGSSLHW